MRGQNKKTKLLIDISCRSHVTFLWRQNSNMSPKTWWNTKISSKHSSENFKLNRDLTDSNFFNFHFENEPSVSERQLQNVITKNCFWLFMEHWLVLCGMFVDNLRSSVEIDLHSSKLQKLVKGLLYSKIGNYSGVYWINSMVQKFTKRNKS